METVGFRKRLGTDVAKGQMRSTKEKKKPKADKSKAGAAAKPSAGAMAAQKWNKTPVGPKKKGA